MGDKSIAFDAKCASYEGSRPDLIPSFLNLTETNKDRALFSPMMDIWHQLGPLCRDWESTLMLLGHEIRVSNNIFYRSTREAARMQVNGADAIYQDLKERYPGNIPKAATPPASPGH